MEDVFIPGKMDKRGGRFGFVRISKGGSELEMLDNLNKIWIGSYRIRAFLPRFSREPKEVEKHNSMISLERKGEHPAKERLTTRERAVGTSYVEALKGSSVARQRGREIETLEQRTVKYQRVQRAKEAG